MSLRRELGLLHAIMMGLGSIICAGIFVILGPAVEMAGPAVILSFLLCGIINMATMLSYCELGAAMPRMGGEYAYVKEAYKGLPSFITGWYEWSSNIFYATLMALSSACMLSYLMPINKFLIIITVVIIFTARHKRYQGSGHCTNAFNINTAGNNPLICRSRNDPWIQIKCVRAVYAKGSVKHYRSYCLHFRNVSGS